MPLLIASKIYEYHRTICPFFNGPLLLDLYCFKNIYLVFFCLFVFPNTFPLCSHSLYDIHTYFYLHNNKKYFQAIQDINFPVSTYFLFFNSKFVLRFNSFIQSYKIWPNIFIYLENAVFLHTILLCLMCILVFSLARVSNMVIFLCTLNTLIYELICCS